MTAEEREPAHGLGELAEWATPEVLDIARHALELLAERLSGPTTVDAFERVIPPPTDADWSGLTSLAPIAPGESSHGPDFVAAPETFATGSLPVIHRRVEDLGRLLTAVHTSLAGHAAHAMGEGSLREPLLGIPGGARPFRDAPDWMVKTLRIPRPEARRRIHRAQQVQPPVPEITGHQRSAAYPVLAEAFLRGHLDPCSLDLISTALEQTKKDAEATNADASLTADWLSRGEETLTAQATVLDPELMRHACTRWRQWAQHALNPDGAEPSDAVPSVQQGLSYRGKRRGFHLWKIAADDLQHEVLSTIAGAATNPRAMGEGAQGGGAQGGGAQDEGMHDAGTQGGGEATSSTTSAVEAPVPGLSNGAGLWPDADVMSVDRRSRHQRQLDGLTSALMGALALVEGNGLPSSGGNRPLVMVTIDYETLAGQVGSSQDSTAGTSPPESRSADPRKPPDPPGEPGMLPLDLGTYRSEAAFTGPISPSTVRTLACDADILPVVMRGPGQILDVGRTQRLFPHRLRRAITARDGGCASPGCTMPAPWCEVHHIQWWTHGGPTSVDNGVLLCSRHHHAVHSGSWDISVEDDGVPWFIPAPYLDPFRTPLRNRYWRA
ncbi:HNH endonuclease signature motif containing protein [Citricoccus sp. K5]|uniref:HNH endonuclease signature motif containing protein n=1 Tax=Citricoccus sp. K5 TaxID=2653135 RepID=UPI0012EFAD8F|nr:HNH endonuclease signature motif containing protein [Citricoccus sp. K5]VXB17991.1 HNH endonuclease [Citricoccus sp. K5]